MPSIYIIAEDGKLSHSVTGDIPTLLLNVPEGATYTLTEPENMFEQLFDIGTGMWYYPEEQAE